MIGTVTDTAYAIEALHHSQWLEVTGGLEALDAARRELTRIRGGETRYGSLWEYRIVKVVTTRTPVTGGR